jgi:hypothetical protein
MSRYNGIRPVTNGLVFCVDASNPQSILSGQTTWSDLSGSGNNGTLTNGPTYVSSGVSSSIQFDGVDDYVSINTPIISLTNNWTYSGWFNMSQMVTGSSFYSQYVASVGNGRIILRLGDDLNSASRFSVFLGSGPTYSNQFLYSNILAGPNLNYNYVVVRSGDTYTQYINGVLDTVHTPGITAQILQTTPRIGNSNSISDFFKGKIFLTQIYNRALSTSEVIQNYDIYNQQRFKIQPPIVTSGMVLNLDTGYYNSYSGAGTTWSDLSGNGNNGTLTNGPTYVYSGASSSIQFDGVDDYVKSNISKSSFPNLITLSICFKLLSFSDIKGLLQFANGLNDTIPWILIRTNGSNTMSWYLNGGYQINQTILTNTVYFLDLTYDGTTWKAYKNGILDGSWTGPFGSLNGDYFWIGNGYNGYTNIEVYNTKLYNRNLTSQEILQNYNAFKTRFGV